MALSVQSDSTQVNPILLASFESLASSHDALMHIDSASVFIEQAEAYWHQRDQAIANLSACIQQQPPFSDELRGLLTKKLDRLALEAEALMRHLHGLKEKLQEQRLANSHQRHALRHYGA
ncbi:MAG: hypothetical protein VKK59_05860 [Vampirovibrionales bacterium]|nr:hypothetical protein [Vampirovibrionales bacterium]